MRSIQHIDDQLISLTINGTRYPGNLEANLRWHINGSYLKLYLQKRKGWNESVWQTIDFHNFGSHFRSLSPTHQVHQSKFVYDLLSLGTHKAKISRVNSPTVHLCPCCNTHAESPFHLLHCDQNPGRSDAMIALTENINLRCKEAHFAIPMIYKGILDWLINPNQRPAPIEIPQPTLNRLPFPQHTIDLIRAAEDEQHRIGWPNATRGFLSSKWEMLASLHPISHLHIQAHDGRRRIITLIQDIFTTTTTIWQARNKVLHDREQKDVQRNYDLEAIESTNLHSNPRDIPLHDRYHCTNMSLKRLLDSSNTNKRRWLMRVRRAKTRNTREDGKTQTRLTSFFRRETPALPTCDALPAQRPNPFLPNMLPQYIPPHNTVQQRMAATNPGRPPDHFPPTNDTPPILSRPSL